MKTLRYLPSVIVALWASFNLFAQQGNMIGRQSQNVGMPVTPAPGRINIDGDLSDWDWSGRIWVFADTAVRSRYSVEAAAMWDADHLYLAAKWKDPTPMYNTIDPVADPSMGWKSDSWQIRVRSGDLVSHFTTWFYTPNETPVLQISYGKSANEAYGGASMLLTGSKGVSALKILNTDEKPGQKLPSRPAPGEAAMAYRADADGKGYVQELRIPWKLLFQQVPAIKAGMHLQIGNEFLWGDPSGKTWPVHRYADNMQEGQTTRQFYWEAFRVWGNADLLDHGHVPVREYVAQGARPAGVVPIRVVLPKQAARLTLAIENEKGTRIRALAGDIDPLDFKVSETATNRTVEVLWDCLDDFGRMAAPGAYRVLGLWHEGIGAEYDMSYYSPGTPPWETKDGTGGWGADHSAPFAVAACGDWVALGWAGAEGGSGILTLGPDGKKKWGDKRGSTALAMDARYVYGFAGDIWTGKAGISRFGKTDGSYQYFVVDGKPRPTFEVALADIFGGVTNVPGNVTGLAVTGSRLVLALSGKDKGALAILDANSAVLIKTISTSKATGIAAGRDGRCYAILDGKIVAVNLDSGAFAEIPTPGLALARAINVDEAGNIVALDCGPDSQAKAYSPEGKLVYTCGRRGGRPLSGLFDEQAMMRMSSLAVDGHGQVWVVENWDCPRRVSVWGRDGKLAKDYIGNTTYAAGGSYLHDEDPTLAYWGPVELKLDRKTLTSKVTQILWVADESKGEVFSLTTTGEPNPKIITSSASGKKITYLYAVGDPYNEGKKSHVVYMPRNGRWQPVAAVLKDRFWNDTNHDAQMQPGEITPGGGPVGGWWGTMIGRDLSIYTDGVMRYKPIGFTDDGAPIYGPAGMKKLADDKGEFLPIDDAGEVVVSSSSGYGALSYIRALDIQTGRELWRYPAPYYGVHGSHNAPMPKPGVISGALKLLGAAKVSDEVGSVFVHRNNIGQDHFFTQDGLYVGALFMDARMPADPLPEKETPGYPLDNTTLGEEPFNGWFGKQADGKYRLLRSGGQAGMIVVVKGLETLHRFKGPGFTVDAGTLVKADAMNSALADKQSARKRATVKHVAKPPTLDGGNNGWEAVAANGIERDGFPERASVRLAYDATHLYVAFEVNEASPWLNEGKDFTRLFKTGDAVDVQLSTDAAAGAEVGPSHVRLLFSQLNGQPVCVLMRPVDKTAPKELAHLYHSPVGDKSFDRVAVLTSAVVRVKVDADKYFLQAAVPLDALGLNPQSGLVLRGDLGFISSDAAGRINAARTYWSNQATGLTMDMPLESWLYPAAWGEFVFE